MTTPPSPAQGAPAQDRLEVLLGPGSVIRFGRVAAWAAPTASLALLTFLHQSVRNVGPSARGGQLLADHIAGILAQRDPEPATAFAAVGPADGGWAALLHGPVQLWDGAQWLAPSPAEGWRSCSVTPRPALSVGPAGSAAPRLLAGSPYDLATGLVPGGGFLLVPAGADLGRAAGFASGPTGGGAPDATRVGPPAATGAPPTDGTRVVPSPGPPGVPPSGPAAPGDPLQAGAPLATPPPEAGAPGAVDLRAGAPGEREALPAVNGPVDVAGPLQPLVPGTRCPSGHFNHPAVERCARCRAELGGRPAVNGPRPPLGVLLADDGTIYRVDGDLVVGTRPDTDPAVAAGRADGLCLASPAGTLAPAHLEIRVVEWAVTVTDRGSASGSYLVRQGRRDWDRLTPFRPAPLEPGSHLSLGQRVLTFVSPWPLVG
ncbi:MAG TPA: hypothetical protein VFN60_04490 [Acidimicrobiales bacterium]|nr:hypothetical protein [Acidimicrobiales bacterium]